MPETAHPDGQLENPSVHHEASDANTRWILIFGGGVLITAVIIHGLVLWFFFNREDSEARAKKSSFPLAPKASQDLPPAPRLEQLDRREPIGISILQERRAESAAELNSYGSTSEKGYVRIPIDRAMKLVLDKLPARKGHPAARKKEAGLAEGGESNSGRMYRGEDR
jgi:hypothetical protein